MFQLEFLSPSTDITCEPKSAIICGSNPENHVMLKHSKLAQSGMFIVGYMARSLNVPGLQCVADKPELQNLLVYITLF